jgi:hypothetical protein
MGKRDGKQFYNEGDVIVVIQLRKISCCAIKYDYTNEIFD